MSLTYYTDTDIETRVKVVMLLVLCQYDYQQIVVMDWMPAHNKFDRSEKLITKIKTTIVGSFLALPGNIREFTFENNLNQYLYSQFLSFLGL